MTTLQAIGFTLAGGSAVFVVSVGLFGIAMSKRSIFIAPRATARPRDVIYNPHPTHACQDRGKPASFGWVRWLMGLTYPTLLNGVPGTGTRDNGMSGSLLKVTMDGIVLLRFHALARRVTLLATFLCIAILLPLYFTAQCYELSKYNLDYGLCSPENYTLTNYERTTLANVPPLSDQIFKVVTRYGIELDVWRGSVEARLYTTAFLFWIIVGYTLYLMDQEWIQLLAMRRVYYLEYDVWGERRKELKQTLMYEEEASKKKQKQHFTFEERDGELRSVKRTSTIIDDANDPLVNREPWIPHPEQRDTVPNVALYSLLVGGLPSLPEKLSGDVDTETTVEVSKRESIDWQLSLTTSFFDHCVPNMPGYSSSVAAVTILPGASDLTLAWRKWYAAAAKLRRLAFIRKQIERMRYYDIQLNDEEQENDAERGAIDVELARSSQLAATRSPEPSPIDLEISGDTPRPIYEDLESKKDYFRQVLGSIVESEGDEHIYEAITFGPEQAAVYSREFAQAAAPCCPNGCREDKIRNAGIDDLVAMEQQAAEEVHNANIELKRARYKVTFANEKVIAPDGTATDAQLPGTEEEKKGHRKTPSLEGYRLPSTFGLEVELTKQAAAKASSDSKLPSIAAGLKDAQKLKRDSDPLAFRSDLGTNKQLHNTSGMEWAEVESHIRVAKHSERSQSDERRKSIERASIGRGIADGAWKWPSFRNFRESYQTRIEILQEWAKTQSAEAVDQLARDTTYAVVTFTSRQAAVAARDCLADGRGLGRWVSISDIPIPPLADAAACDIKTCRNCCRPVTMSIPDRQKKLRKIVAIALLVAIYTLYTIPLTLASSLVSPQFWSGLFPKLSDWFTNAGIHFGQVVSGFATALIWSTFFALCPMMFKSIANFGSGAVSVAQAEFRALQYYWWFMVFTAFTGTLLAQMVVQGIRTGLSFEGAFRTVVRSVSATIPTTISATWLNWIIFRFTITLPMNYLLQFNTFLFFILGWRCCSRTVRGGGPGGVTPYRIDIDSGVVLMCVFALAPASPLVSLFSLVYFLVCECFLRWDLIFVYRPKYDGGGKDWPFLSKMIISGLVVGEILLTTQMVLKGGIGPAVISALPAIPTFLFEQYAKAKYFQAYKDTALFQTSLLDGWETTGETSPERREEFRRFLVDAHRASYVPVCIAGTDTSIFLTAEPAVVVPLETDPTPPLEQVQREPLDSKRESSGEKSVFQPRKTQHGAMLRRAVHALSAIRKRNASAGSVGLSLWTEDAVPLVSPAAGKADADLNETEKSE